MGTHGTSEPWGRIPRNVPLTAEGRQPLSEVFPPVTAERRHQRAQPCP